MRKTGVAPTPATDRLIHQGRLVRWGHCLAPYSPKTFDACPECGSRQQAPRPPPVDSASSYKPKAASRGPPATLRGSSRALR